jgi:hypothetical protein
VPSSTFVPWSITIILSAFLNDDGRDNYQKHKIFLYKEDFEKFREGLDDVLLKIESLKNSGDFESEGTENDENTESVQAYSNISFDDL